MSIGSITIFNYFFVTSFSFAVILWELLTRQMPFGEAEAFTIPVLVTKGKRYFNSIKGRFFASFKSCSSPPLPKKCAKDYAKMIEKCWNQKGEKRLSFDEIVTRLDAIWDDMSKKSPEFAKPTAYKLLKAGDHIELSAIDAEEAKADGYPGHAIW